MHPDAALLRGLTHDNKLQNRLGKYICSLTIDVKRRTNVWCETDTYVKLSIYTGTVHSLEGLVSGYRVHRYM